MLYPHQHPDHFITSPGHANSHIKCFQLPNCPVYLRETNACAAMDDVCIGNQHTHTHTATVHACYSPVCSCFFDINHIHWCDDIKEHFHVLPSVQGEYSGQHSTATTLLMTHTQPASTTPSTYSSCSRDAHQHMSHHTNQEESQGPTATATATGLLCFGQAIVRCMKRCRSLIVGNDH